MNAWFTVNLGDAIWAGESLDQIKALFLSAYESANRPQEMAIFVRHESEGRLHCEVRAYFSPAAVAVAEAVGAAPCPKPAPDGLGLLAGAKESWTIFFP